MDEIPVKKSWTPILIKIAVAVILLMIVYASFIPIKAQVDKYNSYTLVGQCLCPPDSVVNSSGLFGFDTG